MIILTNPGSRSQNYALLCLDTLSYCLTVNSATLLTQFLIYLILPFHSHGIPLDKAFISKKKKKILFQITVKTSPVSLPVGLFPWWYILYEQHHTVLIKGFPGNSGGKESACNAGDPSLIPGSGSSPGEGIGYLVQYSWASLVAQTVKNPPAMWKTWVWSLGWEDSLEGMATNSSILAQRISMDRGAWQTVYSPWSCKELDATEWLSTASPYQRIHTLAEDTKN